ncbi:MAG: nitrate reductase cytochrome c-type subunit; periplasmic nitrate reductase electron transfer subunit [Gammaproteobacteria bacterium]|jgi:cytochrome c-type protein NapB|nr:nitrate reductase cytochrome c-type subunit; periplasmic nitrate reductase electron transfer subunit [Gammaproteobacteria bacterium]
MNKTAALTLLLACMATALPGTLAAQMANPLRGQAAIDQTNRVHDFKPMMKEQPPLERAYVQQPPVIPHQIDGYIINANSNKCLTCHSWENYRSAKATKISLTHFRDRDGKELSNVSASRYFCNQCHVPQVDAQPLVNNGFTPVDALNKN